MCVDAISSARVPAYLSTELAGRRRESLFERGGVSRRGVLSGLDSAPSDVYLSSWNSRNGTGQRRAARNRGATPCHATPTRMARAGLGDTQVVLFVLVGPLLLPSWSLSLSLSLIWHIVHGH